MTQLSTEYASPSVGEEALGQSESFLSFQEKLSRVAAVNRPVLLMGERGTGKELAAIRLHYLSRRWQEPLVTLNCAALSPTLIEAELFGHEKGAFTGAINTRVFGFQPYSVFLVEIQFRCIFNGDNPLFFGYGLGKAI